MTTNTEVKKAQLILVGGRAYIPTILTIIHQRPDIIFAVSSIESHKDLPRLLQTITSVHPNCQIEEIDPIDAFDFSQIYHTCKNAVLKYPNAEWIFNITTGTTIMSIGAYEVAKTYQKSTSIQCCYINTSQTRVVMLPEGKFNGGSGEKLFQIDVSQYAAAYNRVLSPGDLEGERTYAEQHWLPFAQRLGKNPYDASLIKLVMSRIRERPGKDRDGEDKSKYYPMKGLPEEVYPLLEDAQHVQLISHLSRDTSTIYFRLSYPQDKFLNGSWLEMYVWDEVKKQGIFDNCQWNHTIVDGNSRNELDVAIMYKAQLLIVECKTGEEAFASETIYKLDSVANLLGGRFVGKLLVTSLPLPPKRQEFMEQAKSRSVILITAEDLPNIGFIIAEEARHPQNARI